MASNHFDGQASTDYKEAFSLFDKRGNGRVAVDALGDLLRACGQNPTLAEIREQEKVVGGADFDFESFLKVLNRPGGFRGPGEARDYYPGFEVFNKNEDGLIEVGSMKYMLQNLGEKMTDAEFDELMKIAKVETRPDGRRLVDYVDLINVVISN
ncbi:hypothetical protein RB601_005480 [Gaeumannomyces tritici]|uniref:Calmodulin n=1 Tax=Magnaporthiopsis poae (strain ATCC 64411 / 73-15) TaxID=644358 RepID=A0A0C4DWC1_MAGP6|nr:myosin regulatory light chain cdc4 [Magnaporthiopsis poae ATCC 64411]